jgi:hypothetical protein
MKKKKFTAKALRTRRETRDERRGTNGQSLRPKGVKLVWRKAASILGVGRLPITRSISEKEMVARLSAWTTRAGRGFAVRKSECGKSAKTISPRLIERFRGVIMIVNVHFRAVPIIREGGQAAPQVRCLCLINSALTQINGAGFKECHNNASFIFNIGGTSASSIFPLR